MTVRVKRYGVYAEFYGQGGALYAQEIGEHNIGMGSRFWDGSWRLPHWGFSRYPRWWLPWRRSFAAAQAKALLHIERQNEWEGQQQEYEGDVQRELENRAAIEAVIDSTLGPA